VKDINKLYQQLLIPSEELISEIATLDGDILILGVGGKMGPALAKLAKHSIDEAGINKIVIGVSRFSEPGLQDQLDQEGIKTYKCDLLQDDQLKALPDVKNVIYMAGTKFGTSGKEPFTWAMNSYLPGRVAEKYKNSRIVVFSTGNVYHLTPVLSGGATEDQSPQPVGEYAQSCLGRERLFQYFSSIYNIPTLIFRLNYANDVSYGVLLDIACSVKDNKPIDLSMGYVNVIWQRDANEMALRSLIHCQTPPKILNIAGPEIVSVRLVAEEFGRIFAVTPKFFNDEQSTALLSDAAESFKLFGYPKVPLKTMMNILAEWIKQGGKILNKPTHFQERKGQF
jgi:nucleoside-diphosphate-sugar epimerase